MPEEKDADELDTETLLAELEADSEEVPEEVKATDAGDAGARGKASHAFAEQKRKAKAIAALARKQQQEIEELKKNQKSVEAPTPPPAPTAGGQVSAASVLAALTNQAMQNLGLFNITTPEERDLVAIERSRLYNLAMNRRDEESRVSGSAPRIIEEKLSKFDRLDDVGRLEVAKRLGSYNVLQRTDDEVIRKEVIKYLGELALSGQTVEASHGAGDGSAPAPNPQERSSAQAAASAIKGGRGTVRPGDGKTPRPPVKPPSPEELEEMRKLKTTDVVALRAAKQRSSLYKGR